MIAAQPVLGWGLGSFPYIASKFTAAAQPYALVSSNGANLTNIAHNYYLQTAAETGLIGLGLYVAMIVTFFIVGLRALATLKDSSRRIVLIGVLAAMAGQVVDAVTSPSYNIASISLFQWVLMGIGMFAAGVPVQAPEAVTEEASSTRLPVFSVRRGVAGVTAGLVCLSSITLFLGSAGTAVADSYSSSGISDTDAALIGVGGVTVGYLISESVPRVYGKRHHKGDDNGSGQNGGSGSGQGSGSGASPTSYQDKSQVNDRIDDQVKAQVDVQDRTQ
jgi:hypothetical protein